MKGEVGRLGRLFHSPRAYAGARAREEEGRNDLPTFPILPGAELRS
jgi:hypothetical protein